MNNLTTDLQKLIKIKHHDLTNTSHLVFLDDNTQNLLWQIRLEEIEGKKEFLPVLIFTYDEKEVYQSLYPDKLILYSPGVHWILLPEEFQGEMKIKSSPREVILNYINRIKEKKIEEIEKLFKHDLASEFGAFLFAKNLRLRGLLSSTVFDEVKETIYEKLKTTQKQELKNYLTLKTIISDIDEEIEDRLLINNDVNLLYIDDKNDFGWNHIFCVLFKNVDTMSNDVEFDLYLAELKEKGELYIPYDLVILDLNLHEEKNSVPIEERSGYKVLEKIRSMDLLLPVIILTGSEKSIAMNKLKNLGIEGYVSKPHPGMIPDEVHKHVNNFIRSTYNISKSPYLHRIWSVFLILLRNFKLRDNLENAVFQKLKAVIMKFYGRIFIINEFTEQLRSYEYNEILIYLHSIMTDIIKHNQKRFKMSFRGQFLFWKEYIETMKYSLQSEPCFERAWINNINFSNESEIKLLLKFNTLRNQIKPIHGKKVIHKDEALYFFVLVVYELVKDNSELKNKVDSNIKEIIKAFAGRKDLYQDMFDLWAV